MQTLGRIAIVVGLIGVAALNITLFSGVEEMSATEKTAIYARIYLLALVIPVISVMGVILGGLSLRLRARKLRQQQFDENTIESMLYQPGETTSPNWWIFGGSLGTKYLNQVFVVTREVRKPDTGTITISADYGELGLLLITAGVVTIVLPLVTIVVIQHSPLRTRQ